jgi:dephospho-CoA kinase
MKILGLTGGIGSGKTVVGEMFARLGAEIIDADQLAREVVEPGQPALEEIVQRFGSDILQPDGRLDRAKLGGIVFADASARAALNAITHPRIRQRMEDAIAARKDRAGVLVLVIPLLYESARTGLVEEVIVVWVDPQTQFRRLIERGGLTAEQARQRIEAQMPLDEKRALADDVIDNRGSLADTQRQVEAIYRRYAT